MVVAAVRRIVLTLVVLAAATFVSFVFFWTHDLPLKGRPALPAYGHWLRGLISGASYTGQFHGPLWPTIGPAVGHTTVLLVLASLVTVPVSVGIAAIAAWSRGGVADVLARLLAYAAWAIPAFLLALLMMLAGTTLGNQGSLGPFAVSGWAGACNPGYNLRNGGLVRCTDIGFGLHYAVEVVLHVTIPALTLAAGFVGLHARHLRASLLQTLEAPYITTARAKGLGERRVLFKHALRISIATFVGGLLADVGAIFGAALAVDVVFGLGGLGTVLVREFPVDTYSPFDVYSIQLLLLITGAFVLLSTVLADGVLAWLDPRLRTVD